ncbi:uncharacterized protein LODBEIA_P24680 [Lodderomyces beijingensis]|uniref:Tr-type G domain-containing protein n=1 Tax=Lodderomyces beijingensis TaxID=1775926 RepID=A0ABP0ZJC2_9ASCO
MDDEAIYDEFGNLIGDETGSDAGESVEEAPDVIVADGEPAAASPPSTHQASQSNHTHLHSQALVKRDLSTDTGEIIYVHTTDAASNEPVIAPNTQKSMKTTIDEENQPKTTYSREFLKNTLDKLPERIRNVAVVGACQSGKTRFIDQLVLQTHPSIFESDYSKIFKPLRFMDDHKLEKAREQSFKTSAMTLLLQDHRSRSFAFNILDTPGHIDFNDEVVAGLELCDGAILVLDVVIGLSHRDQRLIDEIMKRNLPMIVVLNKIDSLILQLQLPAKDSYLKMFNIIDDVNIYIKQSSLYRESYTHELEFSPILNNVMFASAEFGISFTLSSFAALYSRIQLQNRLDADLLWGEYFYNSQANKVTTDSQSGQYPRTFVEFVLNTIYSLASLVLISMPGDKKLPQALWDNFGVTLPKREYKKEVRDVLKSVFVAVFKEDTGFVDAVTENFPSPKKTIATDNDDDRDNSSRSMLGKVTKLVESSNGEHFLSLARIYSGTLKVDDEVDVITRGSNGGGGGDDEETITRRETIRQIYLPGGRYNIPVTEIGPGTIVLIGGIDSSIKKGATIMSTENVQDSAFPVPAYSVNSVFKVSIEAVDARHRTRLLESLRKANKAYLSSVVDVAETGECTIQAPGELYMDCVLHDVRFFFADDLQIRVSDPFTIFSETCTEPSFTSIPVSTNSGDFSISIMAEPVDDPKLSNAIESGVLNSHLTRGEMSKILKSDFGWDALAARSIWSFAPADLIEPDILIDDTLEIETDKSKLLKTKESIKSGFKWSTNEGPLVGETIRNTKFKILTTNFKTDTQLNPAQIIPLTRRACYVGFLTAKPRLMEPMYQAIAICSHKNLKVIRKLLDSRRGYIQSQHEIEGTPLFTVEGYLPVIDSVGFLSEVKQHTQRHASAWLVFSHWQIVPGDPFDLHCELPKLEPAPEESLARDFLKKTRNRKGLTGEPTLQKYIDADIYIKLKERGLVL